MVDYSILVPAYNEEKLLPATLASLREAMRAVPLSGEIIVCDNNSTDRTADAAREGGARVVLQPVNQISRARNTAAAAAQGRYLVMVDADTHIEPALLVSALERLASGKVAGGGAFLRMDSEVRPGVQLRTAIWHLMARRFRLAAGSFVYVTREAFQGVGGFSEEVYAGEELGFSHAVRRWGRTRGLDFQIIESPPVVTSSRKDRWFSPVVVTVTFLSFAMFPFLLRSRTLCWYWYRRPRSSFS